VHWGVHCAHDEKVGMPGVYLSASLSISLSLHFFPRT
jgi:hypothetical protein